MGEGQTSPLLKYGGHSWLFGPKKFFYNLSGKNIPPRGKIMREIDCAYSRSQKIYAKLVKLKKSIFSSKKISKNRFFSILGVLHRFSGSGNRRINSSHDFTPRRYVFPPKFEKNFLVQTAGNVTPPPFKC